MKGEQSELNLDSRGRASEAGSTLIASGNRGAKVLSAPASVKLGLLPFTGLSLVYVLALGVALAIAGSIVRTGKESDLR